MRVLLLHAVWAKEKKILFPQKHNHPFSSSSTVVTHPRQNIYQTMWQITRKKETLFFFPRLIGEPQQLLLKIELSSLIPFLPKCPLYHPTLSQEEIIQYCLHRLLLCTMSLQCVGDHGFPPFPVVCSSSIHNYIKLAQKCPTF